MDRHFFRQIAIFLFLFTGVSVAGYAACPIADFYAKKNQQEMLIFSLQMCALKRNDDDSQMQLATIYLTGEKGVEKDELQALYMYHLAAETGNAKAQLELSKLLRSFDSSPQKRARLAEYQSKLKNISEGQEGFQGEIYHPYTLMVLAAERPENKWYYPSKERTPPPGIEKELKNYQVKSNVQQVALRDASRWKTRKLLDVAKEVVGSEEYPSFEQQLKNPNTRDKAIQELKKRYDIYVDKKQKERM